MIVCPNCSHQNPDGAEQCEACVTPLPATTTCPNCGATVQADASFCGQCGFNLSVAEAPAAVGGVSPAIASAALSNIPDLLPPDPLVPPEPLPISPDLGAPVVPAPAPVAETPAPPPAPVAETPAPPPPIPVTSQPSAPPRPVVPTPAAAGGPRTQLQQQTARLLHVQSSTSIELPQQVSVIHIGKPNDRIPPDIDVSGFPDSEIVSRIHADIRVEGDAFYIEDVGSSNGTYINNVPLPMGNRHRLRPGDRVALGKGDKVTFLFQLA